MGNVIGVYIGEGVDGMKRMRKVGQDKNNGRIKFENLPVVGSKLMERKRHRDARAWHVRIRKIKRKLELMFRKPMN